MTNTINFEMLTKAIPYKTKEITSKKTGKTHREHYITARDVQAVLDEACGPENWQSEFYKIGDTLFCRIGIRVNGEWVWKSDCGESSDISPEKGEASDAFKRAAVMWGVGRFLYSVTGEYKGQPKQNKTVELPPVKDELTQRKTEIWKVAQSMGMTKEDLASTCKDLVKVPLEALSLNKADELLTDLLNMKRNMEEAAA